MWRLMLIGGAMMLTACATDEPVKVHGVEFDACRDLDRPLVTLAIDALAEAAGLSDQKDATREARIEECEERLAPEEADEPAARPVE